jgi:hypothetical protein
LEHREPPTQDALQLVAFQAVNGATAVSSHADDACSFENVEVPGGRGPAVGEAMGEISRGQLGPEVGQQMHDVSAGFVSERLENDVDFLHRGRRRRYRRDVKSVRRCHNN